MKEEKSAARRLAKSPKSEDRKQKDGFLLPACAGTGFAGMTNIRSRRWWLVSRGARMVKW